MVSASETAAPGATSALWVSTFAFTACFAVWTIFSIIGVQIKDDLGLTEAQFGLLVGTPILTGSLVRVFLGVWTEQFGGRLVSLIVMILAAAATFLLSYAETYLQFLVAALGVGLASSIEGRNPMIDGFGLIAFASLTPMIFVMGYGALL